MPALIYGMGLADPAPAFDIPLDGGGEAAVYVLARDSGEGNDRRPEAGDVRLTDSEIRDIRALQDKFDKFLLVLNVGGVVDLTPVKDVRNILIVSQLGAAIGDSFADVLLGRILKRPPSQWLLPWTIFRSYSEMIILSCSH